MQDNAGPTAERLAHAGDFYTLVGRARSTRKFTMLDDALGRSLVRQKISYEEYSALRRYAHHWAAGGLQGAIRSVDLDRVHAVDLTSMSGLAKTEAQQDHRDAYHAAQAEIGRRLAWVADCIACYDFRLWDVGRMLGYRSAAHARLKAQELLAESGYRLSRFWSDLDRRR